MKSIETEQIKRKKKKRRKAAGSILLDLILVIAVGVMIFAGYNLYKIFSEYKEGEKEYESLQKYVQEVIAPISPDSTETGERTDPETGLPIAAQEVRTCPIEVDFEKLQAVNPDIVGWIYIEAIPNISYPIVQGTDNEYYLKHTVEGTTNSSASIFMDYQNSPDFTDASTIIYGHNMKNQSMFGLLSKMREQSVYDESPYIWILTPAGDWCYKVFSACEVSANDEVYTMFSAGEKELKTYLEKMRAKSEVVSDMTFTGNEYMITLSTCTSNDATRFVVQAVWKE